KSTLVEFEPTEPNCSNHDNHDWQAPYEMVGGIRDNPGVWGKGGGTVSTEVCLNCHATRVTDTWAQGPGGIQGLTSVSYGQYDSDDY
ncbi:hypothetical protein LCGC14_2713330, partial [marine sediment metagenome]